MKFKYLVIGFIISMMLCFFTSFVHVYASAADYVDDSVAEKEPFPLRNFEEFLYTRPNTEVDENCDDYDVCKGKVTNNHSFLIPYYFISRADKDICVRDYPWTGEYDGTYSSEVKTIKRNTSLTVDGIVRNQHNNLWLHVKDTGFVYIENVYYDYDANLMCFYQYITADMDNWLLYFYDCVRPNSYGDIKHWLDPSAKGTAYNVTFRDYCAQLTAEEIGNMNYGSLGTHLMIDENTLLYAGGAVNIWGNLWDLLTYPYEYINYCIGSYCDTPEDAIYVKKGIDYINNY